MPRPVFAYILTVLIAVATFSGLGFVCAAPHTTKSSQHPQGDWKDLVAIAVEEIGDRPQNDTSAIGGINLLLFAGAAMNAAISTLANDDAVAHAPGRFDRRFGGERRGIVERGNKYFAPGLSG